MEKLQEHLLELIRRTSTQLPADVVQAIETARQKEAQDSGAQYAFDVILQNISLAREKSQPICQDTGAILFYVDYPQTGFDQLDFEKKACAAVVTATEKGYLRQNSVDPLTGKNSGNNLGPGSPVFHFHPWQNANLRVRVILKGGGSENVGIQYALPNTTLKAGRDLEGVRRCILDAVLKAQGKGCGPGILGVAIGGDRATGFAHSKEQLLRPLNDTNPNAKLAALEARVLQEANQLEIGPMGFGGQTTLLGVKIGFLNRLPACYFTSISYVCWACRRQGFELTTDGNIDKWLY